MTRRTTVTAAAAVALGLAAAGPAEAAKNEIRIVGGTVVKPGKYVKDNQRFKPVNKRIKSGATVTVRNRTKMEPHTISFIKRSLLPEMFETPAAGPLMAAHQVPEGEGPPGVPVLDNGAPLAAGATLEVDTMGDDKVAGDSAFIAPGQKTFKFTLTASEGSKLYYYCAIHPWMQGRISVR